MNMTDANSPSTDPDGSPRVVYAHVNEGSVHRHATLKKKDSVKPGPFKRSNANTPMPSSPTSPRLDGQRNDVTKNPLYCPVPTNADPTVVLAMRFQAWRSVVKEFINYFKSISSIEDARSRTIAKLNNSFTVPFRESSADEFFLEQGGIQEIGFALKERTKSLVTASSETSRKIMANIIPPLEKLRSDLHLKIKEIKGLSGDFKNSVPREQDHTRRALGALSDSLAAATARPNEIAPKNDPHLLKMHFERQMQHHLEEENFLHQAHRNIESSGRALEGLVINILKDAFTQYRDMLTTQAAATTEFANRIQRTTLDLPIEKEWDAFVADAKDLVEPSIPMRTFRDIEYPGANRVTLIRQGRLERKSKYLKSYSSAFYILTAVGYFHEFKGSHMHDLQVSLFLPSCMLGGHSTEADRSHKFILKGSQSGGMHRGHSWIFRAESHAEMMQWYTDIEHLVNLPRMSSSQRETFLRSHTPEDMLDRQRASDSSSPGLDEDEADRVPYSQINSIEDQASPISPQRPAPGGSFPSETRLADVAMYDHHSRASSEVNDARMSTEDYDLARPVTGDTSGGSIGDDAAFTAAAVAGGLAGGAVLASPKLKDEKQVVREGKPKRAEETAGQPDAGAYFTGTTTSADQFLEHVPQPENFAAEQSTTQFSPPSVNIKASHPAADIALGGLAGGATAAAVSSAFGNHSHDDEPPKCEPQTTDWAEMATSHDVPHGMETKGPVDKDIVPDELNGITSSPSAILMPPSLIRRSKSKKEIVEDAISLSPGNHPEWKITPGSWPETPAADKHESL